MIHYVDLFSRHQSRDSATARTSSTGLGWMILSNSLRQATLIDNGLSRDSILMIPAQRIPRNRNNLVFLQYLTLVRSRSWGRGPGP